MGNAEWDNTESDGRENFQFEGVCSRRSFDVKQITAAVLNGSGYYPRVDVAEGYFQISLNGTKLLDGVTEFRYTIKSPSPDTSFFHHFSNLAEEIDEILTSRGLLEEVRNDHIKSFLSNQLP